MFFYHEDTKNTKDAKDIARTPAGGYMTAENAENAEYPWQHFGARYSALSNSNS